MKTIYKNTKLISLLLSFIFLLQSCHVYKRTPITLDEAVAANRRMKITTIDNKKYKYLKVEKSDSAYYGHTKNYGKMKKVLIEKDKIKSVRQADKTTSTIATVGTITFVSVVVLAFIFFIENDGFYYW